MAKVLITGAAGFIGYHLSSKLAQDDNNEIYILDSLSRGRADDELKKLISRSNVRFFNIDLTDLEATKQIWQYYDEVYHLAAIIGVKHCVNNPARVLDVNLKSTMNLIRLLKENKCRKIVFASTSETYASGFELGIVKVPTDETVPLSIADVKNPRFSYAVSKIAGEQMIIFNADKNYNYTIIRYHNIFGPRMGYAHVVSEILKRIYQKENPFRIYGYDQTRSFCFVQDGVEQTIACMRNTSTNGEIVHIGNNQEEILIGELVKKLFKLVGYEAKTENISAPLGSVKRRCPDISKIKKLTGVSPKVSLDEALRKTIDWYRPRIKQGDVWE
ncbi:MAG: NAD-dependent epimerase/dehydratase family protein [Planctomycetes bacterium]|nr:NAD-dependent epimerase/dehydratase family protein [Planctomycetota bacterium]